MTEEVVEDIKLGMENIVNNVVANYEMQLANILLDCLNNARIMKEEDGNLEKYKGVEDVLKVIIGCMYTPEIKETTLTRYTHLCNGIPESGLYGSSW